MIILSKHLSLIKISQQGMQLVEVKPKFTLPVGPCKSNIEYNFPWIIFADISIANVKMENQNIAY